ncbi:MAG: hypothetical protein Q9195_004819 [Heterodermia aff. obscurata]
MSVFRIRLNCVDHYQAIPTEFDPLLPIRDDKKQEKTTRKVPVIRVFGATEQGQKVCAHIHGAFPYLYIEYNDPLTPDDVDLYIRRLHVSIDHALAVSYRRNVYEDTAAFVAHITLVKGVPFYGFNVGYKFFLKIYMLNPLHMTRLADLLRQGTIMKRTLQPYESHMQYLLQWMCDYNLYGCGFIDISVVKFRRPIPDFPETSGVAQQWHNRSIPESSISNKMEIQRQSHCSLEVDICVQDILNRLEIKPRPIHHDFVESRSPQESDQKLVHSMAGLWHDETRRRKARMGLDGENSSPFPPDVLVSVSADPRYSQPGGWIHEEEYREKIGDIITEEKNRSDGRKLTFDSFVAKTPFEGQVKTTIESVEDLFPQNLRLISTLYENSQYPHNGGNGALNPEIEIDEKGSLSYEEENLEYASDEEIAREMEMSQQRHNDHVEELYAEHGTAENEKNDERETIGKTNRTVEGIVKLANTPATSSQLVRVGISNATENTYTRQDAFEIPVDYGESMSIFGRQQETTKRPSSTSDSNLKRRKKVHDERPTSGGHTERNPPGEIGPDVSNADLNGTLKTGKEHRKSSISIAGIQNRGDPSTQQTQTASTASSREQRPQYSANSDTRLSYPILKGSDQSKTISRGVLGKRSASRGSFHESKNISGLSGILDDLGSYGTRLANSISTTSSTYLGFSAPSTQTFRVCSAVHRAFHIPKSKAVFCIGQLGPKTASTIQESRQAPRPTVVHQVAYYSNEKDVPDRAREYAGKDFKIESDTVPYLQDFDGVEQLSYKDWEKQAVIIDRAVEDRMHQYRRRSCGLRTWEMGVRPPTRSEVQIWIESEEGLVERHYTRHSVGTGIAGSKEDLSQIDVVTQKNRHGFKYSQKQESTSVQHETQYMSVMSLELHIGTRGKLVPNPEIDAIDCVFWCLQSDDQDLEVNGRNEGTHVGVLALSEEGGLAHRIAQQYAVEIDEETSELDLINRMVDIVRHHDPDILTGYEVHGGSWGYMIERARCKYDYNLCDEFSRMLSQSHGRIGKENDRWGFNHTSTIRVTGRHMINIWRAMRGELNLLQYTMENVVFHLLHRRIPHYTYEDLTRWFQAEKPNDLAKVLDYYISRVQLDLEILEQNELIPRTSEQARLLGVDFFSVFSRGSQFKVESLMFRIAKPESYLLPSPSRKQVGQQNALECLPLVMEPQSDFYNSPLLVLDFQSLYPSVMIAYNYCYSTFLGRVVNWRGQNKMGFTDYKREQRLLELLKDRVNISPNGILYAKPEIRKSLLAKMLGEILETRVMVKSGMKVDKEDKTLQRLLNNRQLALKLIANVTYGYTSASFSGRMPCSEIADSIVQTGRETLEKAIALIHSVARWGAEVVYGDTDSLFVYLKGRTKDEAFDIGAEIAKTITDMSPRPIKLKFEKVYFPCVLLAKKRYVGFKYESRNQTEPDFDAKGIETVRRDGTPAEQKIEEKALKILFRTADLSQVKDYFQRQCTKIMKGKVSVQDFCFAKEVKLGTYSEKGLPPPGALISTKRMLEDPRTEPQYGERVPYVVISGAPGARLIDRCVAPDVLLHNENNELDAEYYISKNVIPPLERIFNLVGANVRQWYDEMPKFQRIRRIEAGILAAGKEFALSKKTLESYMKSSSCLVCRKTLEEGEPICSGCLQRASVSLSALQRKLNKAESKAVRLDDVCRSCSGLAWGEVVKCDSKDCAVFYTRTRHSATLRSNRQHTASVIEFLEELEQVLTFASNHDAMGFLVLILVYVFGGLTFLPLLLCTLLLHAHLTFPHGTELPSSPKDISDPGDDGKNIKSTAALAKLDDKFQREHEPDVAAGYFAVCREYVPGGVNGKPPERTTPAGTTVVAPESPSVYQSMYRSIFDRRQGPTLEPGKGNGRLPKRARNVFFVVLRHGHLMLYDDAEQVDPRHVIFLEHHDVSIYGGEEDIPEGELFIKRNSIRLSRKSDIENSISSPKPFYFFSENCSDKEDFYFALLHNQEAKSNAGEGPPRPQQYDVKDIITLVQKLHSSEEHLQTRWLNALIGRLFLALYKTREVEDLLRRKITKKIARVKKPAFLSGIVLRRIDLGEGAPYITNPRLKDLTVDGDCCAEADFKYSGNFRLEVAATARIDLGARFKVREVNLVLAVVIRKLEGHILVKLKPTPSNRVWISFESMPYIDMNIEPIVSSRQITYNIILRAIESRIREVIAETIVLPHWDDSPFTDTINQLYRGGIWAKSIDEQSPKHTNVPDEVVGDEAEPNTLTLTDASSPQAREDQTTSLSTLPSPVDQLPGPRNAATSINTFSDSVNGAVSSGAQKKPPDLPKAIRSRSVASAADPLLSMDNAKIESRQLSTTDSDQKDKKYSDATQAMMAISQRSPPTSPIETPIGSFIDQAGGILEHTTTLSSLNTSSETSSTHSRTSMNASPRLRDTNTFPNHASTSSISSGRADLRSNVQPIEKKYSTASLGAATAAARKWGWSVITRTTDPAGQSRQPLTLDRPGTPERPIGRGQPLPPPGQPLPFPERKSQFSLPRRKSIPVPSQETKFPIEQPPALPQRGQDESKSRNSNAPPPPLPRRRRQGLDTDGDGDKKELLVVEVPAEPSSPLVDSFTGSSRIGPEGRRSSSISEASDEVKAKSSNIVETNATNATM